MTASTLTATQVAEMLQMNRKTVERLLRQGELPGAKIGGAWRIGVEAFKDFWLTKFGYVPEQLK